MSMNTPCAHRGNPHDGYPGPDGRLCRRCYGRAGDARPAERPRGFARLDFRVTREARR